MPPIQIACVVGARPNFIKMAALVHAIRQRPRFEASLIHTGQHFSPEMSQQFFDELGLPAPDRNLGVGAGTQTEQTAEIMRRLEAAFTETRPALVLVVGDVNSTLAAALVASKLLLPVAHVEAGLRSRDRTMPEEINRLVTDVLSDYLFASEPSGVENLLAEGVPREKVFLVGNVMIDTLLRFREQASRSDALERLGLEARGYALATLHRPSNVDDPEQFGRLLGALREIARRLPVVFPAHPRTKQRIESFGLSTEGLRLLPPLGYLDFLHLTAQARLILTDSGGVQEETTILGVPCLTLRENTERPATITDGTNRLVGVDRERILASTREALDEAPGPTRRPDLWDGRAAERILDVLEQRLE